jgi:hypothetical protein
MNYRGYDCEIKALLVGWQVIITINGSFVANGAIVRTQDEAVNAAHLYIDRLLSA